jgi:hypothetical protein
MAGLLLRSEQALIRPMPHERIALETTPEGAKATYLLTLVTSALEVLRT